MIVDIVLDEISKFGESLGLFKRVDNHIEHRNIPYQYVMGFCEDFVYYYKNNLEAEFDVNRVLFSDPDLMTKLKQALVNYEIREKMK